MKDLTAGMATDRQQQRPKQRRSNVRTALLLAAVVGVIYLGFIIRAIWQGTGT